MPSIMHYVTALADRLPPSWPYALLALHLTLVVAALVQAALS